MAEAFAALSIAANIFQFLELGFKATQTIITTYRNIDVEGLAQRNADLAVTASDFQEQCSRLKSDRDIVKDDTLVLLLTRCIDTATKLSTEIGRLKVPESKRHRRRTKIRISIISYWKSNTIEGLQADLVDIRMQICVRLQGLIYEHHRSLAKSVESWGEASQEWNRATEQKLDVMAQQVKDLLKSESESKSDGVNELAQTLAAFAEEAKNHGIIRAILESLHFTQIKERQNEIPKAHKDTFKWIFSENSPGNFSNWLQQSGGIFWITGKPGSGKSTLMKFIMCHETTKKLANTWAEPKPLLLVSHFFWFGGTKLQKSQEGLMRTLLFQILSNVPEIISNVCPDRASGQFQYLESWSLEELSDVFERLQALPKLPCHIFILVDGLDEYSGQLTELTTFLHAIARSPKIKVCCASRPWPEFQTAFSNCFGHIQMHDLTTEDMRLYVQNTLEQNERFKQLQLSHTVQAEVLVDSISTKAEGVFFWVSLVVKSLVRGLNNHDGLETLQRRLSDFPPDLEQFFKRMIDSIEDVYRHEVYRVFSMLLMVNAPLPLILFMARDKLEAAEAKSSGRFINSTSSSFPWSKRIRETTRAISDRQSLLHGELQTDEPGIIDVRNLPKFKEQLLSRCRDLVQAWEVDDVAPFNIRLGFLHRTVIEFLQREEYQQKFDSGSVLHRYFLARSCLSLVTLDGVANFRNKDFVLWFLYILQETQVLNGSPAHDDGYMLFYRCEELRKTIPRLSMDNPGEIETLLVLAQARILVQEHQWGLEDPREGFVQDPVILDTMHILRCVFCGSGYIEVGDRPETIMTNSIDLELLDNLLQIDGFRPGQVQGVDSREVWYYFMDVKPRNAYQAMQVAIKSGAAKALMFFVMDTLRGGTFTEDEFRTLHKLLPPDSFGGSDQRQRKHTHVYRKRKKRV